MIVKRLGAIVAAVVLVAAGVLIRRALTDDEPSAPDGPDEALGLVCAAELEAACRAFAAGQEDVAVTVEPAGATYDRVREGGDAPAVWVTLAPWPAMVDGEHFPDQVPVGSSDLVMVSRTARTAPLAAHCEGTITWGCIADAAGRPWDELGGDTAWGVLKPGHADAARSATGLLTFSTIVSDLWGATDYIPIDLETDDTFQTRIRQLEAAVPEYGNQATTPLDIFLLRNRFDVVGTTRAEVNEKAGVEQPDLVLTAPDVTPAPKADVVVASRDGGLDEGQIRDLQAALTASGWDPPSGSAPGGTGLPGPDVMIALRDLWQGVV